MITDVINGPVGPAESFISLENEKSETSQQQTASVEPSPLPDRRGFNRRWRGAYEQVKDDPKGRSGVLAGLWQEVSGLPPDYKFLNGLAKRYGSGWKVMQGMLKMAACDVVDDPQSYLRKVMQNAEQQQQQQQQQQRRPGLAGDSGKKQLDERPGRRPTASIKPTGSGPGGRFTVNEYLEDY